MAPFWHADPTVDLLDGSRVVQVSAFFDDQPLLVRQLRPDRGRPSRPWRLIAAGTAVCVLGAVALLWGQPGLGALLLLPGIGLGVAAALRQRRPSCFWIGPDRRADLPVAGPAIPLVQAGPAGALLLIPEGAAGEVTLDGERHALEELVSSAEQPGAHHYALPEDARARLQLGPCTLVVESLLPARRVRGALFGELDRDARVSGGCSLALHAVVMALALAVPPSPRTLSLDLFNVDNVWVRPPPPVLPRGARYVSWRPGALGEGSGRRARGDEGQMGSPRAKGPPKLFALKGPQQNPDPHLAAQLARAAAIGRSAGVLELLGPKSGTHLAALLGRGSAIGYDAENALGNLVGARFGEAYGVGGLGLTGTGRGGGGRGEGYIGLGQMGTLGRGAGIGRGAGYGRGVGRLGAYRARACQDDNCIVSGAMNVRGGMDKEIIRRVIRRHINEWRYCYERELQASPDMHGRVTLQFIISPTGRVSTSTVKDSAIGHSRVESCLARAVRRWRFPACNCGGLVIVTYPVLLNVAGR